MDGGRSCRVGGGSLYLKKSILAFLLFTYFFFFLAGWDSEQCRRVVMCRCRWGGGEVV